MSTISRIAELRHGRALHTIGRLFTGELEVLHHEPLGVPALDAGRHEVVVRLSKGLSLPGGMPDVLGVAVKIPGGGAGGGDLDLLLSSSGPFGRLPLPLRGFTQGRFSTLMSPRLTAEPLDTGHEAGADPREVSLPLVFAIKKGQARIALLRVLEPREGEADFDPTVNQHPVLRPRGVLGRLRRLAYDRSRQGRKRPSQRATAPSGQGLPRAGVVESVRLGAQILAPTLLQGVILRRRLGSGIAGLIDADGRATRLLRRLRAKHGDGPLLVRVPFRGWLLLPLTDADVRRVLHDPAFRPATREKRGALAHFAPEGVLITVEPDLRGRRRAFNEQVLATGRERHPLHDAFHRVIAEEIATLPREGRLTWDDFGPVHWRIARRIVLGDGARDDEELTWLLNRLRGDANWSYTRGHRTDVRAAFQRRLSHHLDRAEPGSLAALVRGTPASPDVDPDGQVPHWLFAFDAAGIAGYRALALLAGSPDAAPRDAVRESARLWPTTLAILRDSPSGAMVAIHGPYANRHTGDDFQPGSTSGLPFSDGHGRCPGEDLALQVESTVIEEYLRAREISGPDLPVALPGSLDHFTLRFAVKHAER